MRKAIRILIIILIFLFLFLAFESASSTHTSTYPPLNSPDFNIYPIIVNLGIGKSSTWCNLNAAIVLNDESEKDENLLNPFQGINIDFNLEDISKWTESFFKTYQIKDGTTY